jgi:hypothetical protein
VLGWRFFPRYFFLVLPPLTIAAARGLAGRDEGARFAKAILAIALVTMTVPLIRFAPRYFSLAHWNDLALDEDSRAASRLVLSHARPGATLYIWGYRPEIYVYTALRPATRYLDCQALTGVPADRHLTQSTVVMAQGTHEAREALANSAPDILLDGLSLFNPALSMRNYAELKPWFAQYREVGRTRGTIVYQRTTMP